MKRYQLFVLFIAACLAIHSSAPAACTGDGDGDGVCNNVDACPNTIPGGVVLPNGCSPLIPGDSDRDGDVDTVDFAFMSACETGPGVPASGPCQAEGFDFDSDQDIDMADQAVFQQCFRGENVAADPNCGSHRAFIEDGCLHVIGTEVGSTLALRLQLGAPNILELDVGNDGLTKLTFGRGEFDCIVVDGRGGDDVVIIDETNGVFTNAEVTTIYGGPGADELHGGSGGEVFIGGAGDDLAMMGAGNDRFVWNPGDGTDIVNGDGDTDTVEVNGGDDAEANTVTANGTRVRFDRLHPAPFSLDIGGTENLVINANGGDDSLACTGNLAALISITADGGTGDDTLLGGNGVDLLIGGDGNDFVDGNQGNDLLLLGEGDDTAQWDPGDGSDTIEGQAGADVMVFNGSNGSEMFDFSANGQRLRFTRNLGNIVMDVDGIETFDLQALGSADTVTVNDLAGTALSQVNVDLAGTLGGSGGDLQPDNVIVNATNGVDIVDVSGDGNSASVSGLTAVVTVTCAEVANDRFTINALGDDDVVDGTALAGGYIGLTINGGDGDDMLTGSGGADQLNGDADNDTIVGGAGDDLALMGAGDDRFVWNPGDGTDIVNGDGDTDTVEVNGGDGAENFTVTANGTRVRFDRLNPAPFDLDIGTCEHLEINANDGNDTVGCTGNLAALILITADGGAGNDTLLGGNGPDILIGGDDDDFIDGNQGIDVIELGAGDDTAQWDPGDGNDIVEGDTGLDVMLFNGSNIGEIFNFSVEGQRLRFSRNIGNIVMDIGDVEEFDLRTVGGTDAITVNDLAACGVAQVDIDLAGTLGGSVGDAQLDTITVNGTPAADTIGVTAGAGAVMVSGLSTTTRITHAEAANDLLIVNGLGGVDSITTGAGVTALIMVTTNP